MKITRIQKAKNYRIFRDFTWPATGLPDFSRFNVIYGWNGAGKTSISNIFRHLQTAAPLTDGDVEIQIDKTRVSGTDFGKAAIPPVRVFNRDTVDRNVFEVGGQQFPPVFYLGENSVEKQKLIEELKKQQAVHVANESRFNGAKATASASLESFSAEEAKGIKNLLTVSGGGIYNNYNATNFKAASSLINQRYELKYQRPRGFWLSSPNSCSIRRSPIACVVLPLPLPAIAH